MRLKWGCDSGPQIELLILVRKIYSGTFRNIPGILDIPEYSRPEYASGYTGYTHKHARARDKDEEVQEDQEMHGEGWDTASDRESWGEQEEEQDPEDFNEVGESWEQVED